MINYDYIITMDDVWPATIALAKVAGTQAFTKAWGSFPGTLMGSFGSRTAPKFGTTELRGRETFCAFFRSSVLAAGTSQLTGLSLRNFKENMFKTLKTALVCRDGLVMLINGYQLHATCYYIPSFRLPNNWPDTSVGGPMSGSPRDPGSKIHGQGGLVWCF